MTLRIFILPESDVLRLYVDSGAGIFPAGDRLRRGGTFPQVKWVHTDPAAAVRDAKELQRYLERVEKL